MSIANEEAERRALRMNEAQKDFCEHYKECCGQLDSAGICLSPACTWGDVQKQLHYGADMIRNLLTERDALHVENARLRGLMRETVKWWDWWQADTTDRCASMPDDRINDMREALDVKP